ncbi:MAG: N-acetylneuraminate synthase [Crocinitomicaceae bacterium]|nr:N-acetylneuraminate synthase [Crocinitomicaceae bacterium]
MTNVIIIAEAGVNHNGSLDMAKKLVDTAVNAGVDYIKFQTFKTENLVSPDAAQANYQTENSGIEESQFKMLKKLELDKRAHEELINYCRNKGIKFLSTAFDLESIDLLDELGIELFKIPSGEVTNAPYIEKIAKKNKPVIMSTGMCNLEEVEAAYQILKKHLPADQITILHCSTDYPTKMPDVNLLAMQTLKEKFDVAVGYSDHTLGTEVPIAAVALGAKVIEKHFTLDKSLPGPDHKASLNPDELKIMVDAIRNIELALGNGKKQPTEAEKKNMTAARRSIHTRVALKKGTKITDNDLIMLRPGDGISPMKMQQILGKSVKEDIPAQHKLDWSDITD